MNVAWTVLGLFALALIWVTLRGFLTKKQKHWEQAVIAWSWMSVFALIVLWDRRSAAYQVLALFVLAVTAFMWWMATATHRQIRRQVRLCESSMKGKGWVEHEGELWVLGVEFTRMADSGYSLDAFERIYKDLKRTLTRFYGSPPSNVMLAVSLPNAGNLLHDEHLRRYLHPVRNSQTDIVALEVTIYLDGDSVRLRIDTQLHTNFGFLVYGHGPKGIFYQGADGQPTPLAEVGLDHLIPA